jgi:three-Cys-motif partner protein
MTITNFFDERSEQSAKKILIVEKFFASWANVMLNHAKNQGIDISDIKLGYADLFAGPGCYEDGTPSTPIRILEHTVRTPELAQTLICRFNDAKPGFAEALEKQISEITGIDGLKYQPIVDNTAVENTPVQILTAPGRLHPTLYFFDPWGYKGLTLKLIEEAIGPFGCDCIFFFNFKRVNAAITNQLFRNRINALFGSERAENLRKKIIYCRLASERRALIINTLKEALVSVGGKFNRDFLFFDDEGHPSHFIILTSKHRKAYDIMKTIMAKESSGLHSQVPSFDYDPLDKHRQGAPPLFEIEVSIPDLKAALLKEFRGQSVTFGNLFDTHNVGLNFVIDNYRQAIIELEREEKIEAFPPARERWKGGKLTCGKDVVISFFAGTKQ